jgi:hypothetical protein
MKRLIICFDGTWNTPEKKSPPSNVLRMARMISPSDAKKVSQVVYYDPGVGTGNFADKWLGGVFGNGLEQKVKQGYLFLAHNYESGDEIYVFGFSRGAFSARSLVGFISACGGLLKGEKGLNKLNDAWLYYRTPPEQREQYDFHVEVKDFVNQSVKIDCLGVWDTVGALGIPSTVFNFYNRRYAFHDTKLSKIVKNAFHALAIDEHRRPFQATLWQKPEPSVENQIVEQVWFPGAHANIGGGYKNTDISDLALRWMMARVIANTKLDYDAKELGYFLPEKTERKFVKSDSDLAVSHIKDKQKGPIFDSSEQYFVSQIWPNFRVINNQLTRVGIGPFKKFFRTSGKSGKGAFEQALHWSAQWRISNWKSSGLNAYDPPNMRVNLDDVKHQSFKLLEFMDELKPGTPYLRNEDNRPASEKRAIK